MQFLITPEGWLRLPISAQVISEAQAIRAKRDEKFTNIFPERVTDLRWVGEIGEIGFRNWLHHSLNIPYHWIVDQDLVAGAADFIICDRTIGIKTVKRQFEMRRDYSAQITAKHSREPVDNYFFCCYEQSSQSLLLLGGIEKPLFLKQARYYGAGEQVHQNYQIRPGHEIYNIGVEKLIPPIPWLSGITAEQLAPAP